MLVIRVGIFFTRVDGHKSKSSSVRKHYNKDHAGAVPEDLLSCFRTRLHGGGGPQVNEVTRLVGVTRLSV